ncbi:hypothetical protein [Streptomyces scabiei]|uniref:hypothetical protein n=1 Tax=Streptomyces scabiei TaxID=1930 RepID=UPI0029C0E2CA|nr:hypothetical protein [Streptomyces scabiei]
MKDQFQDKAEQLKRKAGQSPQERTRAQRPGEREREQHGREPGREQGREHGQPQREHRPQREHGQPERGAQRRDEESERLMRDDEDRFRQDV